MATNSVSTQSDQKATVAGKGNCSRGLSSKFMDDLKSGTLKPLLCVIITDDTLSLNIRNDYINIYYRGGSLLKISELTKHRYQFEFDSKYLKTGGFDSFGISAKEITALPKKITSGDENDVASWIHKIPSLKIVMDLWFHKNSKLEREFQQVVERMNNSNSATDYFICDIEYTNTACRELRADLIALNWPSKAAERKRLDSVRLAIIEMKHGDGALTGSSGLVAHIQALDKRLSNSSMSLSKLGREMVHVFNQRVQLGLISSRMIDETPPRIQSSKPEDIDYILLVSDHDPASSILLRELEELRTPPSHFTIKVAVATFTGYGLFEDNMYTLDQFISRFGR